MARRAVGFPFDDDFDLETSRDLCMSVYSSVEAV
jgi:hypothetical protein